MFWLRNKIVIFSYILWGPAKINKTFDTFGTVGINLSFWTISLKSNQSKTGSDMKWSTMMYVNYK